MKYQVAIIDDDAVLCNVVQAVLKSNFDNINVTIFNNPVVVPSLDIYFIDNQFDGESVIMELVNKIRDMNPNALIIAMSGTLDYETLEILMNNGCNAVWNKSWNKGREDVINIIKEYMDTLERANEEYCKGVKGTFKSLADLLSQWNDRLKKTYGSK